MGRAVLAAALLALAAAGCGGDAGSASTRISSDTLTVYTSLPLRGERADTGRAVLRGEKLALEEVGGRVGELSIGLVALDDTRTATGRADPRQAADNARVAAENPTAIAYLGDLDSGATAVSVPITNATGIVQVAPLSSYTGLTAPLDRGEPVKYYPSGRRTLARLGPTGAEEARALAGWMREDGVRRVAMVTDGLLEGLGQGTELEQALGRAGAEVTDVVRVDPGADPGEIASAASDAAAADAQAVVYAGASAAVAAALLPAVRELAPDRALYATSGIAPAALPGVDGLRATSPVLPLTERPPAARVVSGRYRELFGVSMPPEALYGYAAMRAVLDALSRAGADARDRTAVLDAVLGAPAPPAVLGTARIGGYAVRGGRARFLRVLGARPD